MLWFLVPIISILGLAAAIDHRRKKDDTHLHSSAHPDSHAAKSFTSGDDYSGGGE